MSKKKKVRIDCAECQRQSEISFTGKAYVQCCPFCGEEVEDVQEKEEKPILNTFEDYDEHSEYDEDE